MDSCWILHGMWCIFIICHSELNLTNNLHTHTRICEFQTVKSNRTYVNKQMIIKCSPIDLFLPEHWFFFCWIHCRHRDLFSMLFGWINKNIRQHDWQNSTSQPFSNLLWNAFKNNVNRNILQQIVEKSIHIYIRWRKHLLNQDTKRLLRITMFIISTLFFLSCISWRIAKTHAYTFDDVRINYFVK